MRPWLQLWVEPPDGEPYTRPFDQDEMVLGRSGDADVQVMDHAVSRKHTRLYHDGDTLWVEDLGSRNGTRVNGRRINEPTRVGPGDRIEISGTRIGLEDAEGAPFPSTRPGHLAAPTGSGLFADVSSYLPRDPGRESGSAAPELRRYADRLKLMNELHEALSGSLSLDEMLELVLSGVFEHLRPQQAVILLRCEDGEYRPAAQRKESDDEELFFSRSLVREVGERRQAALVLDTAEDDRFAAAQSILDHRVRSLLAAPLVDRDRCLGILALSSGARHRAYGEEDLALLVSVASVAAMRIQAAESRRLEEELRLARRIQERLLPKELPRLDGYRLFASNTASRWVSGDFYSVVEREIEREGGARGGAGHECVVLLADVSGKGVAASLLAASLEALATGPIEVGLPPDEICERVSRRLHLRTPPEKFATCVVVALEPATGRFTYCNAGHNPGFVVRRGGAELELLGATGSPLGLLPGAVFQHGENRLEPGDTLVLYTDGLTEATDPAEEEYGQDRLSEVCRRHADSAPAEMAAAIDEDLAAFTRGVPFLDDRTQVVVQRRHD